MASWLIPKMRDRRAEDTTIWTGNLPVASPYMEQSESEEKTPASCDPAAGWVAWNPCTNIQIRRGCDLFAMLGPVEATQEYDESTCEGALPHNADPVSFLEYRLGVGGGGEVVGDCPVKPAKLLVARIGRGDTRAQVCWKAD